MQRPLIPRPTPPQWRAEQAARPLAAVWPALIWTAGGAASVALDGRVDLGSQALPLVLAAAVSALWLRPWVAACTCAAAVLAFNWFFVPPRGTLQISLPQHALLLLAMLTVSIAVAVLVARQRRLAELAALRAGQVQELLGLVERLRLADGPTDLEQALQQAATPLGLGRVSLLVHARRESDTGDTQAVSDDELAGLRLCASQGVAFGPGTGRYEHQGSWYLPLRGRAAVVGAALMRPVEPAVLDGADRAHAQALCDQIGLAHERILALQASAADARTAQDQRLRNTVLAAISHDYRTPLAAIMGAASALRDQSERLSHPQRERLAGHIIDEVAQLGRLTDNALQLARLGATGAALHLDWQSAEELVGTVLSRTRQRDPERRVRGRIDAGVPLVRCDAVLVVQMLENLVDNALKYTPAASPIEVRVLVVPSATGQDLLIAVRDRGPGVPSAWRERIFDVFQRVDAGTEPVPSDAARPRGAGVGLAVCRAIAQAHGGTLTVRTRGHGGAAFECRLPLVAVPAAPLPEPLDHTG